MAYEPIAGGPTRFVMTLPRIAVLPLPQSPAACGLAPDDHSFLWNRKALSVNTAAAMPHSTAACGHNSAQPAPRRITPRDASISHVVGTTWATYRKNLGIESSGKT